MNTAEAFLADIIATPEDDAPRLIFADWLDDHGEPERAEFIRVQCELAKMVCHQPGAGPGDCCNDSLCEHCHGWGEALRRREQQLLDLGWSQWTHGAFDSLSYDVGVATSGSGTTFKVSLYDTQAGEQGHLECTYSRGFVGTIVCTWVDWVRHGSAVVQQTPLRRVELTDYQTLDIHIQNGPIVWVYHRAAPDGCHPPKEFYETLHLTHDSREDALAALSAGCILWARSQHAPH